MKNIKKSYCFDFECTSLEPATPYICSFVKMDKLKYEDVISITSMKGIIEYIFNRPNKSVFYAHNLKYDISFILAYLFQNHKDEFYIIDKIIMPMTKTIFSIKILFNDKEIVFKDTLALFSTSLANVMKAFTPYEKGETPLFNYINEVEITPEILHYSKMDVLGLGVALLSRLEYGHNSLTTAGGAFKEFKHIINEQYHNNFDSFFPLLEYEEERIIRKTYRGGFTYLNQKYACKTLHNVKQIDVNSMYPSKMYNNLLPYGEPIIINHGSVIDEIDDHLKLGIQKFLIKWCKIKEGFIPFLSNTNTILGSNEYKEYIDESESEEKRTFYLTDIEFKLFLDSYDCEIELLGGWLFCARDDLFKSYIDKFWTMKLDNNKSIKNLGKLFLNSLYGKFAEGYEKIDLEIQYDEKITFLQGETKIKPVGYVPVGIFITSYAREFLIRSIINIGVNNFVYCDTDSIHYLNNPNLSKLEFDDVKLGCWSFKPDYKRAYYIRAKRYAGEIEKDNKISLDIACAGINKKHIKEQVTKLSEFRVGKQIKTIEFKQGVNGQYVRDKIIKI